MSYVSIPGRTKPSKTKTDYPVSLAEAKRHLRVDKDFYDDDDYIQGLIYAGTQKAEEYIGKDIALTTTVLDLYDFIGNDIVLDDANFVELTSIVTDSSVAISSSEVRSYYNFTYIALSTSADADPLTVTYKTGYELGDCPAVIKQAILIKVGDLYDVDRSSYTLGIFKEGKAFERLLDSYKLINFGI